MPNGNGHPAEILHQSHWKYPVKLKGLSGIYLNTGLRNLAIGLVSVFVPIYIFQITNNLTLVFLYYTLFRFILVVSAFPAARLINKLGPDNVIFISSVVDSFRFICLALAKNNPFFLWSSTLLGGLSVPLYWLPYHTAFSHQSKKQRLSRQVAKITNITRLVTVFTPLIGGIIGQETSLALLFPIGVVFLVLASWPIFLDEYDQKEPAFSFSKIEKEIFSQKNKNLFLAFFFQGFHATVNTIAWPILLYLALPNLEAIGGLTTFTLIACLITINLMARKINRFKLKPFIFGTASRTLIWILRGIFFNPLLIILSDPLYQVASVFVNLPYNLLIYHQGKKKSLSFFVERELALHAGTFFCSLFIFLALLSGFSFSIVILFAIIGINLSAFYLAKFKSQELKKKHFRIKLIGL